MLWVAAPTSATTTYAGRGCTWDRACQDPSIPQVSGVAGDRVFPGTARLDSTRHFMELQYVAALWLG